MNTAPFEGLTNDLGLVRMRVIDPYAPYLEGAVAGFAPEEAAKLYGLKAAVPCDENGSPIPFETGEIENGVEIIDAPFTVEIPDNWESLHALQRVRLAREIKPSEGSMKAAEADEIIRAEIERRG